MSIRVLILMLIVVAFCIYAWRDWYVSLCGLILLMAGVEHPDMPKSVAGIPGLNPWNVLLVVVGVAWLVQRQREGLAWDLPRGLNVLLGIYLFIVVAAFARALTDMRGLHGYTVSDLVSEELFNSIKWAVPGILLYDGCRRLRRLQMAVAAILLLYLGLGLQVARWMPPRYAVSGSQLTRRSGKIIDNEIGYHRIDMSTMLAGASWAALSTMLVVRQRKYQIVVVMAFLGLTYAQALTAGRAGYVTWGFVGFVLCVLRWRKLLLLAPAIPVVIVMLLPGVMDRMFEGFGERNVAGQAEVDDYEVTAGRTLIWPYVIDKIAQSPVVGYGRLAMQREGIAARLYRDLGESFPHPHNAYLEMLLDNGALGFVPVMLFYAIILYQATCLFRDTAHPWCGLVGGMALSLVLAQLIGSIGAQTFYPREGTVGMWCAIGLTMRVYVLSVRARSAEAQMESGGARHLELAPAT